MEISSEYTSFTPNTVLLAGAPAVLLKHNPADNLDLCKIAIPVQSYVVYGGNIQTKCLLTKCQIFPKGSEDIQLQVSLQGSKLL